ncbi:hypothetical protein Nepgr_018166 [Nepenthes gracilis]|uniref:Uncharacterized protein n=1 Tax=Nepenthes gracilis TaxID=150966 RepID=A0AAD3SQS9_NEPGR|nr:hypothetical protein Nepgr_018166 [Nepenthes gracilis]
MAARSQGAANLDLFDSYFHRADLDRDGRISGAEAVAFFKGSNLPKQILAQIWTLADQNQQGYLGRVEFYNALKLVTVAQSKRELTPDIVKAALYGPASVKIPAPQITFSSTSEPQTNAAGVASSASQVGSFPTSVQNPGFRELPLSSSNVNMTQQYNQSLVKESARPPSATSGVAARPMQAIGFQGISGGGSALASSVPNSSISNDVAGGKNDRPPTGVINQFSNRGSSPSTVQAGFGYGTSGSMSVLPPRPPATSGMTQLTAPLVDPKSLVSQNGFASHSLFGGDAFAANPSQPKDNSGPVSPASSVSASSAAIPASGGTHYSAKQGSLDLSQNSLPVQHVGGQLQSTQSFLKQNQQVAPHSNSSAPGVSPQSSAGNQSLMQWPKMTQSDVQKYTKVFMEVDKDKNGKITGIQARNLFLSWRLPREVLKQVWDLSDQDNDSMLSLREFCIALYLMERYREGRPLPVVLPSSIMFDLPVTVQPSSGYGAASWGYSPGFQQQQAMPASSARQIPRATGKPPLPVPAATTENRMQSKEQKSNVPSLEKHIVDQLSEEEQKSLNSKFQEATEANKKVEELEKEIKESRERIEFYRAKMQELVLYKSRCDSRLIEVMERAAADKLEVDSLAKKYEEKYRQVGDVASKLTIEDATFRDIQERKMELYRAIVKIEQEGSADGSLQARFDSIQSSLEELVKSLNERCKKYGLRGKPTTLLELPFGWQHGIQEGSADWSEDWDQFEDEGFTFVKELTLDVQNVAAPPKTKAKTVTNEKGSVDDSETAAASSEANAKAEKASSVLEQTADDESKPEKPAAVIEPVAENDPAYDQMEDVSTRNLPVSPAAASSIESPHDEQRDNHAGKMVNSAASLYAEGTQSNHGGAESSLSGDKSSYEPAWGTFDSNDDVDSVWGFDPASVSKGLDHERYAYDDLFGPGDLGLNPIKTGSSHADSNFQRQGPSIFAESVPSTPIVGPSYSPQRYNEGPEDHGFNNFSRFDSFRSTVDSGLQQREMVTRFDSMRSTKDSDFGHGFPTFDDSDPFGSGLFKASFGGETPRRDSDPFQSGSPFRSSFGNETPRAEDRFGSLGAFRSSFSSETPKRDSDPFSYGGPFRSSFGSETPRTDDPFGSMGPFRSSLGVETPRAEVETFGSSGPFWSSMGSETPKRDSELFGSSGPFRSSFTSETPRAK